MQSARGRIVDYLGTHQHLAVDIDLSVDDRGGLRLRSGAQRFYEGGIGLAFPAALTGFADVCEWFDDAACLRTRSPSARSGASEGAALVTRRVTG